MTTLQQKQQVIDCLRSRVITITLKRQSYRDHKREWDKWEHAPKGVSPSAEQEEAYWDMKDDAIAQLQDYGYRDVIDEWSWWQDAFEYAYLDGASQAPVFRLQTGEAIKLMFEWV